MADSDLDPDGALTGWDDVVAPLGEEAMAKFETFVAAQRPFRDTLIPEGGWYLPWLGVEPAAQRTGTGTALLCDMFARLDSEGIATYLETEKAANVPYYLRHGFRVVHEGALPDGGPRSGACCESRASARSAYLLCARESPPTDTPSVPSVRSVERLAPDDRRPLTTNDQRLTPTETP